MLDEMIAKQIILPAFKKGNFSCEPKFFEVSAKKTILPINENAAWESGLNLQITCAPDYSSVLPSK